MKISVDIECTPEEARTFLGLPDFKPVHDIYIDRMTAAVRDGITPADVERLVRTWAPGLGEGWEQWQKMFWQAATSQSAGGKPAGGGKKE